MTTVLKVLLLALASAPGWAIKLPHPQVFPEADESTEILLGTMVFPDDVLPVDITLLHQSRMISKRPQKVKLVVVDNRPPWISNATSQEGVLPMMQQKYQAEILKVDWHSYKSAYTDPVYLQKFFKTGNTTDTIETIEQAQEKSGQQLLGMLAFLEHCVKANATVDLCIFLDPTVIVYRDVTNPEAKGLAEMARDTFSDNLNLTVVNPPTMCDWDHKKISGEGHKLGLQRTAIVSQRYFIVHRARFIKALPLVVPHNEFNVNFEHLFHAGLDHYSPAATRVMTCGQAFTISANSELARCRPEQSINIERHTLLMGGPDDEEKTTPYYGFEPNMADGLQKLLTRVEQGKLPTEVVDVLSVSNMCHDMCPNVKRIQDGLAW